jgi:hypothetical protein
MTGMLSGFFSRVCLPRECRLWHYAAAMKVYSDYYHRIGRQGMSLSVLEIKKLEKS